MSAAEPRILIVYASQHGGTVSLVEAVERGALREAGTVVRKLHGTLAGLDDLLWCDVLVVATPENFGYMAGAVKDFFDRTFYPAQGRVDQLPYAVVVRAGNDGTFCARRGRPHRARLSLETSLRAGAVGRRRTRRRQARRLRGARTHVVGQHRVRTVCARLKCRFGVRSLR
jgi:hypothetical protein